MLRKSRSFKLNLPQGEMNVVSLMDILTTLLFFLLIMSGFTKLGGLDAQGFLSNYLAQDNSEKKPSFTLQVVYHSDTHASIWLGAIQSLTVSERDRLSTYLKHSYAGDEARGFVRDVTAESWPILLSTVQKELVEIKRGFPSELGAVAAFHDSIVYQKVIDAMTAMRSLSDHDEPIDLINAIGQKEKTKVLFPAVIVSEWNEVRTS